MAGYLEVTVNNLQCGTDPVKVTDMMSNKENTLKEIFPEDYNKLANLMGRQEELLSIIDDLLECYAAVHFDSYPGGNTPLLKRYYLELLEELKAEVLMSLHNTH